ncbi:MAG: nuclear transport factor 2 family protein [Candidatus Bathyarchaeota archaeon]|nr:nuclear transport factor 2 family protein [Candidatus Bathyarchaeota archaeon]
MKADSKTQNEVTSTLKQMFDAYQKRDLTAMLAVVAPDKDVIVIGSGADERSLGPEEFGKSAKRDWAQSETASINLGDTKVSMAGVIAWFAADVTFQFAIRGEQSKLPGRLTGVMEKREGKWLLMQMHFSTPSSQQQQGQSWPQA